MSAKEAKGPAMGPPEDPALLDRFKEFFPTSFAVDHRTSLVMLFLIVTIAGISAYRTVPKESFPQIETPIIVINTLYPGVSPADVETLVTRPLEEELNTISDLKDLSSTSVEGYSSILAEFETTVDMEWALEEVHEKVDFVTGELPDDAEDPMIIEFNLDEAPIMQVNVSGEYGLVRLKELGEELKDRMEQIPSILRVDLRGGLQREVKVDVDLAKLTYYEVSLDDVISAIRWENVTIPGGSIEVGSVKYLVRVDGEFDDPSIIEDLVVATKDNRPVYIRDIASVEFGFSERQSYARLDDVPVVTLDVIKRSGENIIAASDAVRAVVDDMGPLFPPSTIVKFTSDQSKDIHAMVSSLENNIISGLILIVGVLLFVLGLRTSIFVAISIPTSMLLSFIVLELVGVSMNMVVLFSLILALGMLVDNAIVIVENIYRYVENGWDRKVAAKKATGEVAKPVIASTLTTLAAFTPLMFWPGLVGEFMRYLPLTLIITLSSSLFVAIVIIPTFCAMFMTLEGERGKPLTPVARWTIIGAAGFALFWVASSSLLTAGLFIATAALCWALYRFVFGRTGRWLREWGLPRTIRFYEGRLRWALDHRLAIIGLSVASLIGSFVLFSSFSAGVEYFPEDIPPARVWVEMETPVGTGVEFTNGISDRLEEELRTVDGISDAESVVATIGGSGGGGGMMGGGPSASNAGRITVSFVDYENRKQDSRTTLGKMQASVGKALAGAEISVREEEQGPATGSPINIEIAGEDPAMIQQLSDEVLRILKNAPVYEKLVRLESDLDQGRPELSVVVDREKAALYDLSTSEVGTAIRGAIQGMEAAKYRTGNEEYDIVVRLAEPYRDELGALRDLNIMSDGRLIPLLSVADWDVEEGYGSIRRKDLDRMATISSDVASGLNASATLAEVRETLAPFESSLAPGYTIRYTGENQDLDEAQAFLTSAFVLALMLIGFILVSQFNSVVKPVMILTSVVMSTAGVLLGLVLFNMPFVMIMTGVGVISLAGIVVNNAIVLIDYIDILRNRDGMDRREALVEGGKTRFRPVILTAITTALGLVPLAIGLNFDFFGLYRSLTPELYWGGEQAAWWGPMAIAVIAGITFATFLTLVLVPVMYSLIDDLALFFRRHFVSGEKEEFGAAPGAQAGPEPPPRESPVPEGEGATAPAYFRGAGNPLGAPKPRPRTE